MSIIKIVCIIHTIKCVYTHRVKSYTRQIRILYYWKTEIFVSFICTLKTV